MKKKAIKASKSKTIILTMDDGMMDFYHLPEGMNVAIIDYDITDNGECPVCREPIKLMGAKKTEYGSVGGYYKCTVCPWSEHVDLEEIIEWTP